MATASGWQSPRPPAPGTEDGAAFLPAEQCVLTADGYRPMDAIDARDPLVTGAGRLRWVTKVFRRDGVATLLGLRVGGRMVRIPRAGCVVCRGSEDTPAWVPLERVRAGDLIAVLGAERPAFAAVDSGLLLPTAPAAARAPRAADAAAREAPRWAVDWVPVETVGPTVYRGALYALEIEEDHSYVSNGLILADGSAFWGGAGA